MEECQQTSAYCFPALEWRILIAIKKKRIDCRVADIIADGKFPALVMVPAS